MRPGRFDRHIEIQLPTIEERVEILKIHTRKMNINKKVDYEYLASTMEHASGADIRAITQEAGMFAIRKRRKLVEFEDFLPAIEKVLAKKRDNSSNRSEYS